MKKEVLINELERTYYCADEQNVWVRKIVDDIESYSNTWEPDNVPLGWKMKTFELFVNNNEDLYEVFNGEVVCIMNMVINDDECHIYETEVHHKIHSAIIEKWDEMDEYEKEKIRKEYEEA